MSNRSESEHLIGAAIRLVDAGAEDLPSTDEEVEFDLEAAMVGNDLVKVYKLIPALAKLPSLKLVEIKTRLQRKFGRDFRIRDFDREIKFARSAHKARSNGHLPDVLVSDRPLRDISRDALDALLAANNPPELFIRSGVMVYVANDEHGRPKIEPVKDAHLRGRMARSANYLKASIDGDKHVSPPRDVVEDILSLPPTTWELPTLMAITEVPTLRPDGTVLDTPGYDTSSGIYYAPAAGLELLPVPEQPMRDDVDAALTLVDEAVGEFPYADQASRANVLGLFLTPIIRPALQGGCTPLALIDAPKAGTGKSLLVDVFSVIATGRPGAMTPYPSTDEEMEKQIGASLMAGRAVICFDNLEGILRSPALALALTAKDYDKRILGYSENMLVPNNATWMVTGNNIRPSGDMPRRCYHIRLDSRTSNPFRGRTFKHPNLLEWVSVNRGRLLHALLVIARAWFAAGKPLKVQDPLGSFEAWHRTVGSIVAYSGVDEFLGNLDQFIEEADENAIQWEGFLWELAAEYPDEKAFAVADLAEQIKMPETPMSGPNKLRRSLPDSLGDAIDKKGDALKRALGNSFSKRRDVRFGEYGIHLKKGAMDQHKKVVYWKVIVPGLDEKGNDVTESET